ncbi:MAG TPA: CsbD family protein [Rhodocyclaceae bacterium]
MAMTWESAESNWEEFKGKLKVRWGKITNAHLDTIAGKRAALLASLQEIYGITAEEAEKQIVSFEEYTKDIKPKVVS